MHRRHVFFILMALMPIFGGGMPLVALAATINVTASAPDDLAGVDGLCSLREAIQSVNNGANAGDCTAITTPDPYGTNDTINLPAGTYTNAIAGTQEQLNANGDLDILKSVTITGAGAATTIIDGGGAAMNERVLNVIAPGGVVTIDGVTIRNGIAAAPSNTGGGISITQGTVNLANAVITSNSAFEGGGIDNGATLNVTNSTISGNNATTNGGGIAEGLGLLNVINSTISGNQAGNGGGIFVRPATSGTLFIDRSTISGNNATSNGGGIADFSDLQHTLHMVNSTISGNIATDGGGIWNSAALITTNATITANIATGGAPAGLPQNVAPTILVLVGGGITNAGGSVDLRNTIVAGQLAGDDCVGTITANLSGLDSDGTCGAGIMANPLLGLLANNGGPTFTHALLAGSPAIDAADPTICAQAPVNGVDQRGVTRPQGPGCDIGAFELEVAPPPPPPPAPTCTPLFNLNAAIYRTGDLLTLGAAVAPWPGAGLVDGYVTVRTPGGQAIYLQLGGMFSFIQAPMISNWQVAPFNGQIFAYTFAGNEPPGIYTVTGSFTQPGTFNPAGPQFCPGNFTFMP
jgi:hypothetical protein